MKANLLTLFNIISNMSSQPYCVEAKVTNLALIYGATSPYSSINIPCLVIQGL